MPLFANRKKHLKLEDYNRRMESVHKDFPLGYYQVLNLSARQKMMTGLNDGQIIKVVGYEKIPAVVPPQPVNNNYGRADGKDDAQLEQLSFEEQQAARILQRQGVKLPECNLVLDNGKKINVFAFGKHLKYLGAKPLIKDKPRKIDAKYRQETKRIKLLKDVDKYKMGDVLQYNRMIYPKSVNNAVRMFQLTNGQNLSLTVGDFINTDEPLRDSSIAIPNTGGLSSQANTQPNVSAINPAENAGEPKKEKGNKTLLYVGIAAAAVLAIVFLPKIMKKINK